MTPRPPTVAAASAGLSGVFSTVESGVMGDGSAGGERKALI
jgi:hypothetical protein